jgi:ATP-dependent DNA ligase
VVAKAADGPYRPGERAMVKIKHERTADVVLAGYRLHKNGPVVGSLMFGLYDTAGRLNYVGGSSAFSMARRAELVAQLAPFTNEEGADHPWLGVAEPGEQRRPGAQHRWNAGKDTSFVALRPELVCEVRYDQLQGDRFRHNARFVRWRLDREPSSCRYDQLETPTAYDLADVLT